MRITLYWPEIFYFSNFSFIPSLTLAQLRSYLKTIGYSIRYLVTDIGHTDARQLGGNEIDKLAYFYLFKDIKKIQETKPDVLLISAWFFNLPYTLEIAKELKKRNPHLIVILGGYPSTAIPEKIVEVAPYIDILVKGEGELLISRILPIINQRIKNLISMDSFYHKLLQLNGVTFIRDKQIYTKPQNPDLIELNSMPFPDFSQLLKIKKYQIIPMQTTRGCDYNDCFFCTSSKYSKFRLKSFAYIEKELKHYRLNCPNIHDISIVDNNFLYDSKRAVKIAELLCKYGYTWSCYSRTDITKKIVDTVIKNNCNGIFFGLESINALVLKKINKTRNIKKYIRQSKEIITYANTRRHNLSTTFTIISKIPGFEKYDCETERILNSYPALKKHITDLQPIPGSYFYDNYDFKLIKRKESVKNFFMSRYDNSSLLVPERYYYQTLECKK
jgi:radical SAM superfamily enzyme YgiQ (UPF0313 family)